MASFYLATTPSPVSASENDLICQLQLLMNEIRRQVGDCFIVSEYSVYGRLFQYSVIIEAGLIRLVKDAQNCHSEIIFNPVTQTLREGDHEVSLGFLSAFGSEVNQVVKRLSSGQAQIFSIKKGF